MLVNANEIEIDITPRGLCGQGGYMHGKYVKASSKELQNQSSESQQVCGTVENEKTIDYGVARISFREFTEDEDLYTPVLKGKKAIIYYDDEKGAEEGNAECSKVVRNSLKRGLMFCISITKQNTSDALKKKGVKEKQVYWGDNCVIPD